MKERFQKTWPYFLLMMLSVNLGYIWLVRDNVGVAKAENTPNVQAVQKEDDETAEINKAAVPTISPIPEKSKTTMVKTKTVTNTTAPVQTATTETSTTVKEPPPAPKKLAKLEIDGLGVFDVEVGDGINAFEMLKKAAQDNVFNLKYESYSWGVMITQIGSKSAEGSYYWALYANGAYAQVGASDILVLENDQIKWSYETW